jgi:hypothetical protein
LAVDPASEQMTPPPVSVSSLGLTAAGFQNLPGTQASAGFSGGFPAPVPAYIPPPVVQTKTSMTAAVLVGIVLIGAGGAGYVKLQNDTQAQLAAKDAAIKQAEEARNRSVETAAKAEVQSRNNLRQCEDKLKAAMAMAVAPAAAPEPSQSAPVVERKPERHATPRAASRASSRRSSRASRRSVQAEPAGPKPGAVPSIARKKKLDNDPLSGLGKL